MELPNKGLDSVISKLNQAVNQSINQFVKLGLCATLLAPPSVDAWREYHGEMAKKPAPILL